MAVKKKDNIPSKDEIQKELTYKFRLVADFYIGPMSQFKTAQAFCEFVEYTSQNMNALKKGRRWVPMEVAVLCCIKLGVSYSFMFGNSTQMHGEEEAKRRIDNHEIRITNIEKLLKVKSLLGSKRP